MEMGEGRRRGKHNAGGLDSPTDEMFDSLIRATMYSK